MGAIFYNVGLDISGAQNRAGMLLLVVLAKAIIYGHVGPAGRGGFLGPGGAGACCCHLFPLLQNCCLPDSALTWTHTPPRSARCMSAR